MPGLEPIRLLPPWHVESAVLVVRKKGKRKRNEKRNEGAMKPEGEDKGN